MTGEKIFRSLLTGAMMLLTSPAVTAVAGDAKSLGGESVYIVNDYRYEPGDSKGDPDTGHALCASRCNSLSVDYRNYLEPGGWRFIKVAENRLISIPLGNPFIGGRCICTADEYLVKANEFNLPR